MYSYIFSIFTYWMPECIDTTLLCSSMENMLECMQRCWKLWEQNVETDVQTTVLLWNSGLMLELSVSVYWTKEYWGLNSTSKGIFFFKAKEQTSM